MIFRKRLELRIGVMSVLAVLLLAGCAGGEERGKFAKLSVEPYELSVKEIELISKTGAGSLDYFTLNGKLGTGEALAFFVEKYEKGKLVNESMHSWGDHDGTYKDVLISFGTSEVGIEDDEMNMMIGVPSGLVRAQLDDKVTSFVQCRTIDGKLALEKEKPAYIASWKGTNSDSLSCTVTEDGGLPTGLEEAEAAYLYKILWTDAEKLEGK